MTFAGSGLVTQFSKCSTGSAIAVLASALLCPTAQAQLTPDATLGNEGSSVTEGAIIRGEFADLIEGGAERGSNLFHSFLEFNIDDGQRVYFANPAAIENILSRITGDNPSNILGTLGVNGPANLFLLNPNGIVFGENAALDITGSFYATTGEAIQLGDEVFSATEPEQSQLLTVSPSVLLANYVTDNSGDIENRGRLAAMGDLSLAATNLDLQGQVAAGGDLTLMGLDTVQIRDAADAPFIGFAGGDLLVQGNEQVDIVALSHPDSGLYSYGDMVLRSANPVGGDAHYRSLGEFRIESSDGNFGSLYSPNDPIILARGDVSFDAYQGASLHIFAGGEVNIPGFIQVIGPDVINGVREDVVLSDGTIVEIRGNERPTVDIRAGIDQTLIAGEGGFGNGFIFNPFPNLGPPTLTPIPSSSDINLGVITFTPNNVNTLGGNVLITNQYLPNSELPDGDIQISDSQDFLQGAVIDASSTWGDAGSVFIDARGDIQIDGTITTTSILNNGNAGNIQLLAAGDIELLSTDPRVFGIALQATGLVGGAIDISSSGSVLLNGSTIASNSLTPAIGDKSGSISIDANSVSLVNGAGIVASSAGGAEAGDIQIFAASEIEIIGENTFIRSDTGIGTEFSFPDTTASAGNIILESGSLRLDGASISALTFNRGNSGHINLLITVDTTLENGARIGNSIQPGSTGNGQLISIQSGSLDILSGSQIQSNVVGFDPFSPLPPGQGNSGSIEIDVDTAVRISGEQDGFQSGISTVTLVEANGNAGPIELSAKDLIIEGGAARAVGIFTSILGTGNAGNIDINLADELQLLGTLAQISSGVPGGSGNSGDISIEANSVQIVDGAGIISSHAGVGSGIAGDISINAEDEIEISGDLANIQSFLGPGIQGRSGDIEISSPTLSINNGGTIATSSFGFGRSGDIAIFAPNLVFLSGSSSSGGASIITTNVVPFSVVGETDLPFADIAVGDAGNVEIEAGRLELVDGGIINTVMTGTGNAGSVTVSVTDSIVLRGVAPRFPGGITSQVDPGGIGDAGRIDLSARTLTVENGAQVRSLASGQGNGAPITVNLTEDLSISGSGNFGASGLLSLIDLGVSGIGGNITVNASNLFIDGQGQINASNLGTGRAGNITLNLEGDLQAENADISTFSQEGGGGSIHLTARQVFLRQDSDITSAVVSGAENAGNIFFDADFVFAFDDSDITAFSLDGRGGNIDFSRTRGLFAENYIPDSPPPFDFNARVDINATGSIASGEILIPDVSVIENSLNELSGDLVDTATLTAGSCIARDDDSTGSFVVTGGEGLLQQPGGDPVSVYPTGTVQTLAESPEPTAVQEPQGVYQLTDGRLVLSHECN